MSEATPTFAIVGEVNHGKSSVVSTLSENDQVRISAMPGETVQCQRFELRDLFVFYDTPGFQNAIEALPELAPAAQAREPLAIFREFIARHQGDAAFAARYREFIITARAIISAEGWRLNTQKTRVMRASVRQSFTGLVVNERLNVPRDAFDRLKAWVHRFATREHASIGTTDECAVLLGQVAWLAQSHPARAAKLRAKVEAAQVAQKLTSVAPL